ncbi:MAG: hypothetical protein JO369_01570 [Paucibacter sp.]|nr:hypothetical protein [Roseateles sp.]
MLKRYFARLPAGRIVLWCYLIWWACIVWRYFDPTLRLWCNSAGLAVIIGLALRLSFGAPPVPGWPARWQNFRTYFTPFAVSSFAALIKGQGFILVVPPRLADTLVPVAACATFVTAVLLLKLQEKSHGKDD